LNLRRKEKEKEEDDSPRLHPLIEGLLKELPEPKTEWPIEERKNWLEMVSGIFNVIYKTSDDSRGSLKLRSRKILLLNSETPLAERAFQEGGAMCDP